MNFLCLEVNTLAPDWKAIEVGQLDDFRYDSRGYGKATPWKTTGTLRRQLAVPFLASGMTGIAELRKFLDRRRGRQRACWQPTYSGEFTVAEDVAGGLDEITLVGHRYSVRWDEGLQHRFIALMTRAGKFECYAVTAVDDAGDDDVLTLGSFLRSDLVADETVCCPLLMMRLAEDDHDIEYLGSNLASVTLNFIECPREYPDEDANSIEGVQLLGTRPVFLYLISDGTTTLRYADYGVDVTAASETWQAADISGGELVSALDMLGDAMTLTLRTDDASNPLLDYLDPYNFRNYAVSIYLADLDDIAALDLAEPEHHGDILTVEDEGDGALRIEVSSVFRLNERQVPRIGFQRPCPLVTFSDRCGASEGAFTTSTTISAIQNTSPPYVEAAAFGAKATAESDPNWFALGKVTVGDEVRVCTGQDGNRLYLNYPFKQASVSDSISAAAGDDHRVATCDGKFNRLDDNLGITYLPAKNPSLQALELPKTGGGKK
jgi:hypothetical protein